MPIPFSEQETVYPASMRIDSSGGDGFAPSKLGPYLIGDSLGEGGMGRVYIATQTRPFQREVAIKLLKRQVTGSHLRKDLQRECEVLAQLHHPNIAAVLG